MILFFLSFSPLRYMCGIIYCLLIYKAHALRERDHIISIRIVTSKWCDSRAFATVYAIASNVLTYLSSILPRSSILSTLRSMLLWIVYFVFFAIIFFSHTLLLQHGNLIGKWISIAKVESQSDTHTQMQREKERNKLAIKKIWLKK